MFAYQVQVFIKHKIYEKCLDTQNDVIIKLHNYKIIG